VPPANSPPANFDDQPGDWPDWDEAQQPPDIFPPNWDEHSTAPGAGVMIDEVLVPVEAAMSPAAEFAVSSTESSSGAGVSREREFPQNEAAVIIEDDMPTEPMILDGKPNLPEAQSQPVLSQVAHKTHTQLSQTVPADQSHADPGGSVHPPYLVPPLSVSAEDGSVSMITVMLRPTGDRTRDVLRLRRIHGIITSYPGNDRFAFHVFERGRGYLLEFPNYTVGLCPELLSRLAHLIGADNVRVEKITFQ
jgi:hypothetical protein